MPAFDSYVDAIFVFTGSALKLLALTQSQFQPTFRLHPFIKSLES
jgi:hypothetical protein